MNKYKVIKISEEVKSFLHSLGYLFIQHILIKCLLLSAKHCSLYLEYFSKQNRQTSHHCGAVFEHGVKGDRQ